MADRNYSAHQQKIIKRYYDSREQIDSQRLAELGTELYLASGKKLEKLWVSAEETMRRMKVPESRIAHVMSKKEPGLVAEVVKDLETGKIVGK